MSCKFSNPYAGIILIIMFSQLPLTSNASRKISYDPSRPHGQTKANHLRDSVSVSNFGSIFGRRGSALLSRTIVSPDRIWNSIDDMTREFLGSPDNLDWLVADVAGDNEDSVTINFGFSCLDLGKSESLRLVWWVDTKLQFLKKAKSGVGGADIGDPGVASKTAKTDLVMQCWHSNKTRTALFVFEHRDLHQGNDNYLNPALKFSPFLDDPYFFQRIKKLREETESEDEVVYDEQTSIPIAIGLPFTTGFRLAAPPEDVNESPSNFRVPATPFYAVRSHMEARLSGENMQHLGSTTTNAQVVLSVLSTGLAIILAVWIVMKLAADSAKEKSVILRKLGSHAVVQGRHTNFAHDRMHIVHQVIGVTILSAPFAFAIINGEANPSKSVMVTTGITIFYGKARKSMSSDTNNPHAGSPYVLTGWLSVTNLDNGHYTAFSLSVAFVLLASFYVAIREGKRWSETVPHTVRSWPGFCVWKSHGAFRMWFKSLQHTDDDDISFQVLVELADRTNYDSSETEPLLVASSEYRKLIREYKCCKQKKRKNKARKSSGSCELYSALEQETGCSSELCLYGNVVMNNRYRYESMMAGTKWWYSRLPREFYYLTSRRGPSAKPVEWYRTNGQFMPDELLIPVRMGLLPYLAQVKRITIAISDSPYVSLDGDGVSICIVNRQRFDSFETRSDTRSSYSDQCPIVRMLHEGDDRACMPSPSIFQRRECDNGGWRTKVLRITSPVKSGNFEKVSLRFVSMGETERHA